MYADGLFNLYDKESILASNTIKYNVKCDVLISLKKKKKETYTKFKIHNLIS